MSAPHDVVVVGAGPAGAAAASLLAQAGLRVLVLEGEHFPRPHIGESLLPLGTGVLERLGVDMPAHARVFKFKRGAQFICETTQRQIDISFDEALPGPPRHAWQVERAEFDTLLRDRALAAGAEVRHGVHVTGVDIDEGGVTIESRGGSHRARFLVDASGQGRLMARRAKAVRPYRDFGVAAAYQHFDDVGDDRMGSHGDIRIMMRPEGWGWVIPLPGRRLSVGIVTRDKGAKASMIEDYVASSPLLSEWTRGARASAPTLVGNYAFRNEASHGARYVCVGDAACFLDPVFSSGVSLALSGAERAADLVIAGFLSGREADPDLTRPFAETMKEAYEAFGSLIRRFYHSNMVSNLFFDAPEGAELRAGIVSVLAGDVWRDDNPFQRMLARSRRMGAAV